MKAELDGYLFYDFPRYRIPLLYEGVDQCMFTENINHTRYSSRIFVDRVNCLGCEYAVPIVSSNPQSLGDILAGFINIKRESFCAQTDSLAKLTKLRLIQVLFKLGLPRQNNLQQSPRLRYRRCQ